MTKVIFIPGNGNSSTKDNWYPSTKLELEARGLEVISVEFPDPYLARMSYWIPFLRNELKAGEDTILVGHSSGAIAAMRFAEKYKILGSVLIGTYHTDLGTENEKKSGYFDEPWNWASIKQNQKWTVIFASQDDPWIPISEPRYLHKQLNCEYHEFKDQGHFGCDYDKQIFPELSLSILHNLQSKRQANS